MLDLISDYVGTLITTLIGVYFVKYILDKRIKLNIILTMILILLVPALITFSYIFDYMFLRTLSSCLLCMILFKYAFKLTFHEAILYSVVLLTVSEMFVFLVVIKIISMGNDYLYNVFAGSVLGNVVVAIFFMGISRILKKLLVKISHIKIKNYLAFYVVLLFVSIIIFFYITFSNIGKGIGLFSGIAVIVILLLVITSLLIQVYRNNELTIKYDKLLDFIKKYEVEIDNQRTMRHEIKNQLLTIKSKIIDKDKNNNIINYIDEILKDNNKEINHTVYAKLGSLPANGLKGMFYFKVSEAYDKDINVSINISKGIDKSVLNDLNSVMFNQVGKLLGILLDNAIEAAELTDKKIIGIEIYVVNDKVNIIISNSYIGKIKNGVGMFSRSTKSGNRGHGLLLAKAIVNSNNRLELETEITEDLYIQKLIVQ